MRTDPSLFPSYLSRVPSYVWGGRPAPVPHAARLHLNEVECEMPPELVEHLGSHIQQVNQ